MQTIIISEQEREQTIPPLGIGGHILQLVFGLLLGIVLLIFDRPHNSTYPAPQPHAGGGGWRPVGLLLGITLGLIVVVMLIVGP